jgi:hypothetical protein
MAQMTPQGEIDPETIKSILAMSGDDLEIQAMIKQMAMADSLRGAAIAPGTSKNVYGALAQGLAGYGSGREQEKFDTGMKGMGQRKMTGRSKFFDALFPKQTSEEPELLNSFDTPQEDTGAY